ncbi:hypothetical protein [Paenibacillus maysiensis]|uniref:hypothetical protein n=1 Tax=Paenibacillus maysiensis TaxID=1155954 RepID=UPI00046E6463|nr:hypothetical protein [Paenibacillus maysiensis]
MDIRQVLDTFLAAQYKEELSNDEEKSQLLCELLLEEFKQMTPEDLRKHFKNIVVNRQQLECVLTLSFPVKLNSPT